MSALHGGNDNIKVSPLFLTACMFVFVMRVCVHVLRLSAYVVQEVVVVVKQW